MNQEEKNQLDSLKNFLKDNKIDQIPATFLLLNLGDKYQNIDMIESLGCYRNSDGSFMANSSRLGENLGKRGNSVTKYFSQNGFEVKKSSEFLRNRAPPSFNYKKLKNPKSWTYFYCERFTRNTTIDEIKNWKKNQKIKDQIGIQKNTTPDNNPEVDPFIEFEISDGDDDSFIYESFNFNNAEQDSFNIL